MGFAGHTGYVTNVVIVEDARAVSSSLDRTVRLWDLASGAMLAIFTGESEIRSLAVTRGGTIVAGEQSLDRVHFLRIQG
jgi:WD40 repeat protein